MNMREEFDKVFDSIIGVYTENEKEMLELIEIMEGKGYKVESLDLFKKCLKKEGGIILVMDILSDSILYRKPLESCWEDGEELIRTWNGVRFDVWNEEYPVFHVKSEISEGLYSIAYIGAQDRQDLIDNCKFLDISKVKEIIKVENMFTRKYLDLLSVISGIKMI